MIIKIEKKRGNYHAKHYRTYRISRINGLPDPSYTVSDHPQPAYDKNGDDVIQLAFEVDNDTLEAAVESIRALKMLGSNISMPNKTVVHKYLDEVDEAAKLCGAINTVVNTRDKDGNVTGYLKGYNTDGMGYWQGIKEEGIDFKGMKMVLIGTGGAATAIAVRGALDGIAELHIFNIKDKFYARGEEIVDIINKNSNCKARCMTWAIWHS